MGWESGGEQKERIVVSARLLYTVERELVIWSKEK